MNVVIKRGMVCVLLLNTRAVIGGERYTKQSDTFKRVKYQPAHTESFSFVSQLSPHDAPEANVELPTIVKGAAHSLSEKSENKNLAPDGLLPHWHALQEPMLDGVYVTPAAFLAAGIEKELQPILHRHDNEIAALGRQYERDITCAKRSRWAGRCAVLLSMGGLFAVGNVGVIHAINALHKNKCG